MRSSIELPSLRDHFKQESLPPFSPPRSRELLPPILGHSPPGRSSTLPPIQRNKLPRSRKSSITQGSRKPKHDRRKSKEYGRRPSVENRKALSAEPQTAAWAQGKRWEDLIEAATSATEADDERYSEVGWWPKENLSNVQTGRSPTIPPLISNITSAPKNRSSLPPAFQSSSALPPPRSYGAQSYTASPLHKALTPPFDRGRDSDLEPFPSIESSIDPIPQSKFPGMRPAANSDSSPVLNLYPPRQQHRFSNPTPSTYRNRDLQIYCASCKRPWSVNESYACTECICGVCRECVGMFITSPPTSFRNVTSDPGSGGTPTSYPSPGPLGCPRCRTVGGKWKAFQLDFK